MGALYIMASPIYWGEAFSWALIAKTAYLQKAFIPQIQHSFLDVKPLVFSNWLSSYLNFYLINLGGLELHSLFSRIIAFVALWTLGLRYWWNRLEWSFYTFLLMGIAFIGALPLFNDNAMMLGLVPAVLSYILIQQRSIWMLLIVGGTWANVDNLAVILPVMVLWQWLMLPKNRRQNLMLLLSLIAPMLTPMGWKIYQLLWAPGGILRNIFEDLSGSQLALLVLELILVLFFVVFKKRVRSSALIGLIPLTFFSGRIAGLFSLLLMSYFSEVLAGINIREKSYKLKLTVVPIAFLFTLLIVLSPVFKTKTFSPPLPDRELEILMDYQMQNVFAQAEIASIVPYATSNFIMIDKTTQLYSQKDLSAYQQILHGENLKLLDQYQIQWVLIEKDKFKLESLLSNHAEWEVLSRTHFFLAKRINKTFASLKFPSL